MYQIGSKYIVFQKEKQKMEMLAMLSGLPCILVIVWGLAYVWFISKGYTPTKWYKLIGYHSSSIISIRCICYQCRFIS